MRKVHEAVPFHFGLALALVVVVVGKVLVRSAILIVPNFLYVEEVVYEPWLLFFSLLCRQHTFVQLISCH